jgi:stage II sporulation protein D
MLILFLCFVLSIYVQPIRVLLSMPRDVVLLINNGSAGKYLVTFKDNTCKVNGQVIKDQCVIKALKYNLPILINDQYYQGAIVIKYLHNNLYLINTLDLEDYVRDVVFAENYSTWPLAAYQAQAIAARTYAYYHMINSANDIYDVTASPNIHQAYHGFTDHALIIKACQSTKNKILTFAGKPIKAMYSSCCGGVIPAKMKYPEADLPYLKRNKKCIYCAKSPNYKWQKNLDLKEQKSKFHKLGKIKSVKILKKDSAGVVLGCQISGQKSKINLKGNELRNWLNLKSSAFELNYANDILHISGRGFGHFLGLCQWGAKFMAEKGYSYQNILKFYYPGIRISKISI